MGKGTPPSRRCWARLEWKGALELVGVNNEIGEEEPKREGEEVLELSFLRLVSFPFFFFFFKGHCTQERWCTERGAGSTASGKNPS